MVFSLSHVARDAPAALFYFSGAVVGTAAGLAQSALPALPESSIYVPRMLKVGPRHGTSRRLISRR